MNPKCLSPAEPFPGTSDSSSCQLDFSTGIPNSAHPKLSSKPCPKTCSITVFLILIDGKHPSNCSDHKPWRHPCLLSFSLRPHLISEEILLTLPLVHSIQTLIASPLLSSWAKPPLFLTQIMTQVTYWLLFLPPPFPALIAFSQHNPGQIPSFIFLNSPVLSIFLKALHDQPCLLASSPTTLSFPDFASAILAFLLVLLHQTDSHFRAFALASPAI